MVDLPPNWDTMSADALYDSFFERKPKSNGASKPDFPLVRTSKEFSESFVPPDFVWGQILIRGFLYALTAKTGGGKTSVLLRLAAHGALGLDLAGKSMERGRWLYLAAENDLDVQMRWIALSQQMQFDINDIEVYFVPGTFNLSENIPKLCREALHYGGDFIGVIVDTAPAFYAAEDANDRVGQQAHAEMLRSLTTMIPGNPVVIAACHPRKYASDDDLIPAGGGTFLNSIDGNFTLSKSENITELGTQGKFRGIEFAPMNFLLRTCTHERLKTKTGILIPTVFADYLSEEAKERMESTALADEDRIIDIIRGNPRISIAAVAIAMGWYFDDRQPKKAKAQRYLDRLVKAKLIARERNGTWVILEDE